MHNQDYLITRKCYIYLIILFFMLISFATRSYAKDAMIILGSNYDQKHEMGLSLCLDGEWDIYSIDTKPVVDQESYTIAENKNIYRIQLKTDEELISLVQNITINGYTKYNVIDSIHFLGSNQSFMVLALLRNMSLDVKHKLFISPLMENSNLHIKTEIFPELTEIMLYHYFKQKQDLSESTLAELTVFKRFWDDQIKKNVTTTEFIEKLSTTLSIGSKIETFNKHEVAEIFNEYINYDAIMADLFVTNG